MGRKVSPVQRFRKELMDAVGEASLDFSGYCRLAAQAMLQTAMEGEVADFLGRESYQRRREDQGACGCCRCGADYNPRPAADVHHKAGRRQRGYVHGEETGESQADGDYGEVPHQEG
jgi:hypothetical protein